MGIDDSYVPYLPANLEATPRDTNDGFKLASLITPLVTTAELPLTWTCLNRDYYINRNKTLSFCPGSTVRSGKVLLCHEFGCCLHRSSHSPSQIVPPSIAPYSQAQGPATEAWSNSLNMLSAPFNPPRSHHPPRRASLSNSDPALTLP